MPPKKRKKNEPKKLKKATPKKSSKKKSSKKIVKKKTEKKPASITPTSEASVTRGGLRPCICIENEEGWFCMRKLPSGELKECDGPFDTKEDCEAHFCN